MAMERTTNRLIDETSPYLLQHAHNPVDWYPWGAEAFARARREDKPIFLSVGYSACHWCHVMEAESFDDVETAALLNAHFVAIKVDREERPDVDETYMKAVQMLTGSGGWPLSVFLTPEAEPFYGGTYFPPETRYGRLGFREVLAAITRAWQQQRDELVASAGQIVAALGRWNPTGAGVPLSRDWIGTAAEQLAGEFDASQGGFGGAPKFPQPGLLSLLLVHWHRTGETRFLDMVTRTLDAMQAGGICDHLGGGFHRYATDADWLVPHFEKMLYDQALLAQVYTQAYQVAGDPAYTATARRTLDYVLRDMTDPTGGFYAAEDADSEGREGAFYVWSPDEIVDALGPEAAEMFCRAYGITSTGNFEGGKSILHVTGDVETASLASARQRLLERRRKRPRPSRDEKVIAAWNGLMISSLAQAGAVLGEERYVMAAGRAADFLLNVLRVDGRLMRYRRDGKGVGKGYLEDYAFVAAGLMDLYEASFEPRWLQEAVTMAEQMLDLFGDEEAGGLFLAGRDADRLVARGKPAQDGAVPSGNSVAALVLLKLGRLTTDARLTAAGQGVLEAFSAAMQSAPTAFSTMLQALDYAAGPTQEIVIAGSEEVAKTQSLVATTRRHFLPAATILLHSTGPKGQTIERIVPFVTDQGLVDGRPAAYLCENYACREPVTDADRFEALLARISRKQ